MQLSRNKIHETRMALTIKELEKKIKQVVAIKISNSLITDQYQFFKTVLYVFPILSSNSLTGSL